MLATDPGDQNAGSRRRCCGSYLGTLNEAIWRLLKQLSLGAFARFLAVPMLKEGELIGGFTSIVKKFARLPTSKSNWSRTLPLRRSLPSRMRGCSTNCVSDQSISRSVRAANRHLRSAPSHLNLSKRS